jgi:hypothetical protein
VRTVTASTPRGTGPARCAAAQHQPVQQHRGAGRRDEHGPPAAQAAGRVGRAFP